MRREWVTRRIEQLGSGVSSLEKLNVFVGTWNVNAHLPTEDLSRWLKADAQPDIYAIGLQEAVELNAGNAVSTNESNMLTWEQTISRTLLGMYGAKSQEYTMMLSRQLVGIVLFVFVRMPVVRHLRDVQADIVKVGFKGMAGNKGGIAVSMFLGGSAVSFVCCHLAAGLRHVEQVGGFFVLVLAHRWSVIRSCFFLFGFFFCLSMHLPTLIKTQIKTQFKTQFKTQTPIKTQINTRSATLTSAR
jgi:hypothetical protein